jgi:long-chain fatty acid transport protein
MKKTLLVVLAVVVSLSVFANGFNLNTLGAKAFGMGGAMIGLADDPTAIFWNPAGLATQSSALQLAGHDIMPTLTYAYKYAPAMIDIDAEADAQQFISPALFWNHKINPKMALGFGFYVPSGIGARWEGKDLLGFNGPAMGGANIATEPFDWESMVNVMHAGPAIAYQATDRLSLGATAEVSYGTMELHMADDMMNNFDSTDHTPDGMMDTQYNEESHGLGFGVNLGLKYQFDNDFSIGATYRSPVHFAFKQDDVELITAGSKMTAEMTRYVTWPMMLMVFRIKLRLQPLTG